MNIHCKSNNKIQKSNLILVIFFLSFLFIYDFNQINELFKLKTSGCDLSPPIEKVSLVKKTCPKIETVSTDYTKWVSKTNRKNCRSKMGPSEEGKTRRFRR
jgi:hypothetical protein